MYGRLARLLLWIDYHVDGIRWRLLIAAAMLQVFLAPMWDRHLPTGHAVAARLELATFLSTLLFGALTIAIILGRLVALSVNDEEAVPASRWVKLKRFFAAGARVVRGYWRLFRKEDALALAAQIGAVFCVATMALRGAIALLRWGLWQSLNGLEATFPSLKSILQPAFHTLESLFFAERAAMNIVMYVSFPTALAAAYLFLRKPGEPGRPAADGTLRLWGQIDPLLARKDPTGHRELSAAIPGTSGQVVTQLLADLSTWEPPASVQDENGCRDDIAFFLRERRYGVAMESWISSPKEGRRRVDLVVNGQIAMELKYDIHEKATGERDRVFGQVHSYANIWGTRGPVLLFLARTPRPRASRYGETAERWNADLSNGAAPILVVADS